jgi:hypothetical protein
MTQRNRNRRFTRKQVTDYAKTMTETHGKLGEYSRSISEPHVVSAPSAPERDIELENQIWRDPDWICPRCKTVNMAIRKICRECRFDSPLVSEGHYFPAKKE